ncbi:MAG: cyclic nucleotide-binding domain-containing protein [Nitrospinales bacterium]
MQNTPIVQHYADNEVIVSEGVLSNNAYIILAGKVKVTKKVGKKTVLVGSLKQGEVFGEMGLITKTLRSANVSAVGDVTIGIIDKERFDNLMKTVPDDFRPVLEALVQRLRITTEKLSRVGVELEKTRRAISSFAIKRDL